MTTATKTYSPGKFVYHELYSKDPAASKAFYCELFGWTAQDLPLGPDAAYTRFMLGDTLVAGLMPIALIPAPDDQKPAPHWAVYVSVEDVDAATERAVARGGKLLSGPHEVPGMGRWSVMRDPQGAMFRLFKSEAGDGEDVDSRAWGRFCWESLNTSDVPAGVKFYQDVVGWGTTAMGDMPLFTRKRAGTGEPVGVASTGEANGAPHWGTFVSTPDTTATLKKAKALGAKILVERTEIPTVGAFGILIDPTEAQLFLFEPAT
jgi:predicted enzyme related to lactoylglutathione lyase